MKKILALILLVGCIFTLCSCKLFKKDKENTDDNNTDIEDTNEDSDPSKEAVAAIQAKIDASTPKTADITVTLKAVLDDLYSEYNVTYNQDGTATVVYTYEKFNDLNADSDEHKSAYSGTATVSPDGTVSDAIGGTASVEALTFDISLDAAKLENAEVIAGVLTATVKAANTAAVLGVELGADASLAISTSANGVTSIAIAYASAAGPVEIIATYTYPAA